MKFAVITKKYCMERCKSSERGAALFLVAITALIVMVAGAIAVDLAAVATRGQSLQNAADSAALAGVQAYRESMGDRVDPNADDEAAARAAVNDLLAQNGINDITPGIEFPDAVGNTEVKVTLFDDDAGFLLSGFTGGGAGTVERIAVARFDSCDVSCSREVAIPPPFNGVDAAGDGDGYKPIAVGNSLYSINHQSGAAQGSLQITCVLRGRRHRADRNPSDNPIDKTDLCWDDASGRPVPGKTAYPSSFVSNIRSTPEMPHSAVVDTRIYWATSTRTSHYMFCFETTTATPCAQPLQLNNNGDGYNQGGLRHRESHRGGGTVVVDDLVYTFTDDHQVHCVIPSVPMQSCSGYPRSTSLGVAGLPANDPDDGNHGSSIDRIVHPDSNRIYSTLHVPSGNFAACIGDAVDVGFDGLRAAASSGIPVVIQSNNGLFLEADSSSSRVIDSADPDRDAAQWRVYEARAGTQRVFAFRNEATNDYLVMNQSSNPWNESLELTNRSRWSSPYDYVFIVDDNGESNPLDRTSEITTYLSFPTDTGGFDDATLWESTDAFRAGTPDTSDQARFKFFAPCAGTFLNCHQPGAGTCSGFSPVRLHVDGSSFSGRLFFHRSASGTPTGVCSTGFSRQWVGDGTSYAADTEITCVTFDGADADALETDLSGFRNSLALANTGATVTDFDGDSPLRSRTWGTWGDPHYNEEQNRVFYPTHRIASTVICWDFATGSCGENVKVISPISQAQDYGFISEGNCVFGLGHTANFYAFKADAPTQPCDTSSTSTWLDPCNCGGDEFWGTLEFDVTESQFEEFFIEIRDENDVRVYPASPPGVEPETAPHDLLVDGSTIDLRDYPVFNENSRLEVLVTVKSFPGIDPWSEGDGSQTFTVEIARRPRLTG